MEEKEMKILEAIKADVRANADLVEQRVSAETKALQEDQIRFFKKGLEKENETYLEGELQDLRLYAAVKSSCGRLETRKQLLELRGRLAEELFQKVYEDLQVFMQSTAYIEYLRYHLGKITPTSTGIFMVREQDIKAMQELLQEAGYHNPVQKAYFSLGGFQYMDVDARMEYSCLLKERFDEAKEWFRENSGFRLTEREEHA